MSARPEGRKFQPQGEDRMSEPKALKMKGVSDV